MSDKMVSSISGYVDAVHALMKQWDDNEDENDIQPWFRGVGNSDSYKLQPRLYREEGIKHLEEERKIRIAFKTRSLPFVDSASKREDWDWYFLMQHYGVPTRLLDWTESALVALYFALYSWRSTSRAVPGVWVMNPYALNKITVSKDRIMVPSEQELDSHLSKPDSELKAKLPVAVLPQYTDRRMLAQQSRFTIHGLDKTPLEEMDALTQMRKERTLVRLVYEVNSDTIRDAKRSLATLGVTSAAVFPDLTGLSSDLRREYTPGQE